jgi:hypothetical protein
MIQFLTLSHIFGTSDEGKFNVIRGLHVTLFEGMVDKNEVFDLKHQRECAGSFYSCLFCFFVLNFSADLYMIDSTRNAGVTTEGNFKFIEGVSETNTFEEYYDKTLSYWETNTMGRRLCSAREFS